MKRNALPPSPVRQMIPEEASLPVLRATAWSCTGCELFKNATQTVFGEGPAPAPLMLVGEQPGDEEDVAGRPFVGPAGRLLDRVLEEAGVDRALVYVTNAVKHFKYVPVPRGKRRLHQKPNTVEVSACRPWLEAEIRLVNPKVIVCLGATAAQALMGPAFRLTQSFGRVFTSPWAQHLLATYHPSAALRMPDEEGRDAVRARLRSDLKKARDLVSATTRAARSA